MSIYCLEHDVCLPVCRSRISIFIVSYLTLIIPCMDRNELQGELWIRLHPNYVNCEVGPNNNV
jgi:Lon protease-like protein